MRNRYMCIKSILWSGPICWAEFCSSARYHPN